jgi:hypothetical protein
MLMVTRFISQDAEIAFAMLDEDDSGTIDKVCLPGVMRLARGRNAVALCPGCTYWPVVVWQVNACSRLGSGQRECKRAQDEFEALTAVLKERTRKTAGAGAGRTGFRQTTE